MSTPHAPEGHGHGPVHAHDPGHARSEEDRIHASKIVWVGAGSLFVFILAAIATTLYYDMRVSQAPKLPIPAEIGASKIGMVEQQLFELSFRGENDRQARQEKLRSYGWADRGQGLAHMPIERAMELAAKGVRAPATPPRAPSPGGAL